MSNGVTRFRVLDEVLICVFDSDHRKTMLDDDDRQLRLMKEMYLEDGDLHSEGGGRMRKFRWRNIGASQMHSIFTTHCV